MRDEGLRNVLEDCRKKKSSSLSYFQDVTLLAMEEISTKLPERPEVRETIQKAAQEFEKSQRGLAITANGVTVIGMKI